MRMCELTAVYQAEASFGRCRAATCHEAPGLSAPSRTSSINYVELKGPACQMCPLPQKDPLVIVRGG